MKRLIFATQNRHKVNEVNQLLGSLTGFEVVSLSDCGIVEDIPETAETLEGNARQKAYYVFQKYGYECFSEDTGLEVEALGNAPGIYSARYAGVQRNSEDNIAKLLNELTGIQNRRARFRTVICLLVGQKEYMFEGIAEGIISTVGSGSSGFGYDPIFIPNGYDISFAQMGLEEKNRISHRAKAMKKLADFLRLQK